MPVRQETSQILLYTRKAATDSYIDLMSLFFIYAVLSSFPLLCCFNFGRDSSNFDSLHRTSEVGIEGGAVVIDISTRQMLLQIF